jgi:hypothetical protein
METANDLMQALVNPQDILLKKFPDLHKQFLSEHPTWDPHWIFRGHGNSNYRLVPSAFRTSKEAQESINLMRSVLEESPDHELTPDERKTAELRLVCAFYKHCNRAGLPLPPLNHALHKALLDGDEMLLGQNEVGDFINTWPRTELLPLFGIAQHYGIPTRLLDWTHNPFVATYFAAESAIEKDPVPTKKLAVWLCATRIINNNESGSGIQFIELATAVNPNMSLQQGVFTLLHDQSNINQELNLHRATGIKQGFPVFLKLELPTNQATELLKILSTLGYSASRVYHGFQGAANAAKEQYFPKSLKKIDSVELPTDVMDHFKTLANESGQPYQDLIKACLRDSMDKARKFSSASTTAS